MFAKFNIISLAGKIRDLYLNVIIGKFQSTILCFVVEVHKEKSAVQTGGFSQNLTLNLANNKYLKENQKISVCTFFSI